jgi:hypothetical protein
MRRRIIPTVHVDSAGRLVATRTVFEGGHDAGMVASRGASMSLEYCDIVRPGGAP